VENSKIDLDSQQVLAVVEQTGYVSRRSLVFLYWLVKNIDPRFVLELGTGYGCSAVFMALATETVRIISIDDYSKDFIPNDITNPQRNLEACGVQDRVELIEWNTMHPLYNFWNEENSLELLFMDASHGEGELHLEFGAHRMGLLRDHIIVVDDYWSMDVHTFVSKLAREYPACFVLNFHQGLAVLVTDIEKYFGFVTDAVYKANYVS